MSSEPLDNLTGLEIAVIGMACQFPGAQTVQQYWQNLLQGVCSLKQFSVDELVAMGQDRAQVSRPEFIRVHGAVEGFDQFDAGYFGINAREADVLDPQHRLLLKVIGHALEDAGYDPARMQGTVGVFAGCSGNTYYPDQVLKNAKIQLAMSAHQAKVLNLSDFLATRASYAFGLTGPAFTVQAACATSLVAAAMGCQSLLSGACDLALAGGSSLTLPQHFGYEYQEGMILSPDGACRAFDAQAAGTLKGDGAGIVVLKRLADALADGDHIEAVITGFATNNDGHDKAGYLAPGLNGQMQAILAAQMMAGVDGDAIEYIEAHGTATPMGDPIEVAALTQAFQTSTQRRQFCGIGSVKTNMGHLDAAAGVAGLIKAILTVKHGVVPASLNFNTPNPKIDFANSPFYVNTKTQVWPSKNTRRAGVSSFGMGGSNVHIIVEQPPAVSLMEYAVPQVLPLSAAAPQAILDQAQQLADRLEHSDLPLAAVAATLQQGRRVLKYRTAVAVADRDMAIAALRELRAESITPAGQAAGVVFLMPGQGAQYVGMAAGLYQRYDVFKAHVDECALWLKPHLNVDLRDLLLAKVDDVAAAEQLKQTAVTQPALFTISTGLAKLWQSFGVQPRLLLGHSIGELAAAQVAGVFSLADGLQLAMMRGRLMQAMQPGAMLSVTASEAQLAQWIQAPIELAAVNGPDQCVLAGPIDAIEGLQPILIAMGWSVTSLQTSHAFHSQMMQPMLAEFARTLAQVKWLTPTLPMLSSVSGQLLDAATLCSPQYWLDNARHTVRFHQAAQTLLAQPQFQQQPPILLEVGPGRTLTQLIKKNKASNAYAALTSLRHVKESTPDALHWLNTLGALWKNGVQLNWQQDDLPKEADQPSAVITRVSLPGYVYQQKRHWVDVDTHPTPAAKINSEAPLTKRDFEQWFYQPSWEQQSLFLHTPIDQPIWLLLPETEQARVRAWWQEKLVHGQTVQCLTLSDWAQPQWQAQLTAAMQLDQRPPLIVDYLSLSTPDYSNDVFMARLTLIQALVNQGVAVAQITYLLVAEQVAAWSSTDAVNPLLALPLGLLRVLQVEFPGMRCRVIDTPLDQSSVPRLLAEAVQPGRDTLIVWRQQQRWRQTFTQVRLPVVSESGVGSGFGADCQGMPILVTGGLGGMGLALATELAKRYQCRLLLLSRRGGEVPASLVALGIEARVASVDVTDLAAMQNVIAQTEQDWGPIQAVIHAAGVAGGGMTAYLRAQDVNEVLSAKVQGAQVLQQLLVDSRPQQPLRFWLMCSSLASCVSLIGRSEYTAANLYLDQLATQLRHERGIAAVSINWDAWSGVGMASDYVGDDWILPDEGTQAMLRILSLVFTASETVAQMLVSTRDLQRLYFSEKTFDAQQVQQKAKPTPSIQPSVSASASASVMTAMQQQLHDIWCELLGLDAVRLDDNFFDVGGDSVVSLQLVSRAKLMGLMLKPQQVFDYPTLRQLAISLGDDASASQQSTPTAMNAERQAAVMNATEKQLHDIWCELLGLESIGLDDNFFDLGGDSVVSLQLVSRVKALGLTLKPQQVFDHPTLRGLGGLIGVSGASVSSTPSTNSGADKNVVTGVGKLTPAAEHVEAAEVAVKAVPKASAVLDLPPTTQLLMSSAQQRMWFLEQLDPGSTLYSLRGALLWNEKRNEKNSANANPANANSVSKPLDVEVLRASFQYLMQRHEVLRVGFTQSQGEPQVFLADNFALPFSLQTVVLAENQYPESDLRQRLAMSPAVFALHQPPLWNVECFAYGDDCFGLVLTFHHIIIENWSLQIFLRELWLVYDALLKGQSADQVLPVITHQYRDFVAWQLRYRLSADYQTDLHYWRQQLADLPQLELPLDKVRPAKPSHQGAQLLAPLSAEQVASLRAFSQSQQVSLFMTLQACVLVLLQRLSGQTQIAVGTPVVDRPHVAFESMIGVFLNNVVLKNTVEPTQTFQQLVKQVRNTFLDAQTHQAVPFDDLVKVLQPVRDMSRAPLFQVLITYLNIQVDKPSAAQAIQQRPIQTISAFSGSTEFDLSVYFHDMADGGLQIKFEYATDLFVEETIARYQQQLIFLCTQLITHATQPLQSIFTLPPKQWRQLAHDFNHTQVCWPTQNLPQVLSACAAQHAQALALQDGVHTLTYQQLQTRVHQWAHWLLQQNLAPESCIGVCMHRQNELVVLLLAIWAAGYAYVPIDPNYPADRIAHVLNDCQAPLLLVDQAHAAQLPALTGKVVVIEQVDVSVLPSHAPSVTIQPSQLAYVIYTSGSTGLPKGVQLEHRALHNFILAMQQSLPLTSADRLLAVTTVSFDIHILELFLPLSIGASVYVADAASCLDGTALLRIIQQQRMTAMQATPATWQLLLESGWQKPLALTVLCGGEALSMSLTTRMLPLCAAIWNLYGPTETTVWSSVAPIRSLQPPITVGHPIANTQFYLLDAALSPVPMGALGELYIGGDGVSRGYLHLEKMTAERFITLDLPEVGNTRVYATGDQARWLADGRLQVMGRLDSQIKLRGFRIELGEIEYQLAQYPGVSQAVVIVRELAQGPALIAYWISDKPLDVGDLRQFIGQRLPHYMLPSYWVAMTEFPKTPNQKIDRKALPQPVQTGLSQEKNHSTLLTPAEQVIADIFKQVLNHAQVTAYDNFFDLGGHSLLSMKVVEALYQRTGIRMHPGEMFQQTVGQLAAYYGEALLAQSGALSHSQVIDTVSQPVVTDNALLTSQQSASPKNSLLKRLFGGN